MPNASDYGFSIDGQLPANRGPMTKEEAVNQTTDSEAREILADLPFEDGHVDANGNTLYPTGALAEVFIDADGRLNILLKDGGWLGVKIEHVMGDIAPFAG